MSDVDERGKLDALQQAETGRGLEFDAEEARLLDELLASADLTSPTPESRSGDRVSPAGTPHDLDQVPPEQSLQPLEDQVTVSRQDFGAPEPLAAFSAPPVESPPDAVGVLAAGEQGPLQSGTGLAAEEATQPRGDAIPVNMDSFPLGSSDAPEGNLADATTEAARPEGEDPAAFAAVADPAQDLAPTSPLYAFGASSWSPQFAMTTTSPDQSEATAPATPADNQADTSAEPTVYQSEQSDEAALSVELNVVELVSPAAETSDVAAGEEQEASSDSALEPSPQAPVAAAPYSYDTYAPEPWSPPAAAASTNDEPGTPQPEPTASTGEEAGTETYPSQFSPGSIEVASQEVISPEVLGDETSAAETSTEAEALAPLGSPAEPPSDPAPAASAYSFATYASPAPRSAFSDWTTGTTKDGSSELDTVPGELETTSADSLAGEGEESFEKAETLVAETLEAGPRELAPEASEKQSSEREVGQEPAQSVPDQAPDHAPEPSPVVSGYTFRPYGAVATEFSYETATTADVPSPPVAEGEVVAEEDAVFVPEGQDHLGETAGVVEPEPSDLSSPPVPETQLPDETSEERAQEANPANSLSDTDGAEAATATAPRFSFRSYSPTVTPAVTYERSAVTPDEPSTSVAEPEDVAEEDDSSVSEGQDHLEETAGVVGPEPSDLSSSEVPETQLEDETSAESSQEADPVNSPAPTDDAEETTATASRYSFRSYSPSVTSAPIYETSPVTREEPSVSVAEPEVVAEEDDDSAAAVGTVVEAAAETQADGQGEAETPEETEPATSVFTSGAVEAQEEATPRYTYSRATSSSAFSFGRTRDREALAITPAYGDKADSGLSAGDPNEPEPPAVLAADLPAQQADADSATDDLAEVETAAAAPARVTATPPPPVTETTLLGETRKLRRLRLSRNVVAVLAVLFLVAALGAGYIALKQNRSTTQWRQRDATAIAYSSGLLSRNGELSKDLLAAHGAVSSLSSQTSRLDQQVKSLQAQLSAAGKANGKALAHSALYTELTNEEGTVTTVLAVCVGDMSSLRSEIDSDLARPAYKDPHLQSNTQAADSVCATARQDNQHLQSTLSGAA